MTKIISIRGRNKLFNNHQLTRAEIDELRRCVASPSYFINTYVKRIHMIQGVINVTLEKHQLDYVEEAQRSKNVIAMLPRQAGTTLMSLAFVLWETLFKDQHRAIVLGINPNRATNLADTLKTMFDHLPSFIKPVVKIMSRTEMRFANGSSINFGPMTSFALRGLTYNRLFLDSFAYAQPKIQQDLWLSFLPSSTFGGRVLIGSTPNGKLNAFATIWENASKPMNSFTQFRRSIDDIPSMSHYRQSTQPLIDEVTWKEQFMCEFV